MPESVALVTGGSRGIGRAVALKLASQGLPVVVNFVNDIDAAKELVAAIQGSGGEAMPLRADVSDGAQVDRMFDEVEDAFGPVGILVNNAGIRRDGLALSMSDDAFERVVRTNLFGTFACCRRAIRTMLRSGGGRIVNVSSVAGLRGSPGQVNYAASKAAVIGLTKTLAREVGRKGITVNAVAPGIVTTELTAGLTEKQMDALVSEVPARRSGLPDEVASAVAYLCSEEATYVNGEVLVIDGGMTA